LGILLDNLCIYNNQTPEKAEGAGSALNTCIKRLI